MKQSSKIVLYTLSVIAIVIAVVWANVHRRNSQVRAIEIVVDYTDCDTLVVADDLKQQLLTQIPDLPTRLVKNVDVEAVKNTVEESPYVKKVRSSVSVGCSLVVNVVQRRPILRVFYGNKEFYLDTEGKLLPLSKYNEYDVLVGNGCFRQRLTKNYQSLDMATLLADSNKCHYDIVKMWQVARFLDESPQYGELFDQIYVDPNGDLVLTPKVGNHIVILGDEQNLTRKMENLWIMYNKGMQQTGWNTYKQISLKFGDLVICTRRK